MKHGSVTGYSKHRCRCDACMTAWRDYQRVYMREWSRGKRRLVLTEEARTYIAELCAAGWTKHAIAAAAGMDHQVVFAIAAGTQMAAYRETVERILAVAVDERPAGTMTPAAEAVELIEAMCDAGLLVKDISRGLKVTAPARLRRQRHVQPVTRARLVIGYRLLARRGIVPPRLDLEAAAGGED